MRLSARFAHDAYFSSDTMYDDGYLSARRPADIFAYSVSAYSAGRVYMDSDLIL